MLETAAYLMVLAGTVLDEVSTRLCLARDDIYETNQTAILLMSSGLWLPIDVLLAIAMIAIPMLAIRRWSFSGRKAMLAGPIIYGGIRLAAGIWNIHYLI